MPNIDKKEKRKSIKKKILFIILLCIVITASFLLGRQNGISNASNTTSTTTTITEVTVETQTIQKTLTSSGQINSAETESLSLSTSKYFSTMCVEEDDAVAEGDNILKYSDGTYLTADRDCIIIGYSVPETGSICTSSNYVEVEYTDILTLDLSISETEILEVEEGQEVEITLTADETKTYTGEITKIDAIASYSSSGSSFAAVVEFENDGNIKLGMSASCTIILEEVTDVIAVPIAAVQETDDGAYVVCVNEDGSTENVDIEIGISNDNYVEVTSGLEGGETVQVVQTTTTSSGSNSSYSSSIMGGQSGRTESMDQMQSGGFDRSNMGEGKMSMPSTGGN